MTQITDTVQNGIRIVTVTVDPGNEDHAPIFLSPTRGDLIVWQPPPSFTDLFTIQKIEKVALCGTPDWPFPPEQKQQLNKPAVGFRWGPAKPDALGHAYKYTIQVGSRTVDPHIVIGP